MDDYITFVEEQIAIFRKHATLLNANHEITPMLLNKNLAEYTNVGLALNAEYRRANRALVLLKSEFQKWWDKAFTEMRHELNPVTLAATKWASKAEIEAETRVKHEAEFYEMDSKLKELEARVEFLSSLRGEWEDHIKIIICLSQNARQEMAYLPTEIMRKEKQGNIN